MQTLMNQAAFARHRGVSRFAVTHWKRLGLLVMRGGLVDVDASEAKLAERPDIIKGGKTNQGPVAGGDTTVLPTKTRKGHPIAEPARVIAEIPPDAIGWTHAEAARRKEISLAILRDMEVKQKRGELVPIAGIRPAWARVVIGARDAILALPERARLACGLNNTQTATPQNLVREVLTKAAMGSPNPEPPQPDITVPGRK
jgi:hypothetical protein